MSGIEALLEQQRVEQLLFLEGRLIDGMHNRVERYVGGKAISQQPPPRTVHLVGNVTIEPAASDSTVDGDVSLVIHSTVHVAESRPGVRVDWVGRVIHHLVERQGALRIVFKKVMLVDNDQELTTIDFLL
jgi:benzoate/toluate 1,2-dioxygenase beta subunit